MPKPHALRKHVLAYLKSDFVHAQDLRIPLTDTAMDGVIALEALSELDEDGEFVDRSEGLDADEFEVFAYEDVKKAVFALRDNDPDILRILWYYIGTALSRTRIADEVDFDASTVKRKADRGIDLVLQKLRHGQLPPPDLFAVVDPKTQAVTRQPYPKTYHRAD